MTTAELVGLGEAAKKLGIDAEKLRDLIRRRKIAEPSRVGGRRVFTREEIEAARAAVKRNV